MAKDSYKKRMKGSWNQGKAYKGDGEERAYARTEIKQFVKEMDENYQEPYKKSKRRRNEKARLEHRIKWCEQALARYKVIKDDWFSKWIRSDLEKAKKQYAQKYGDKYEFKSFPKIEHVGKVFMSITQKIHGTNAQIVIEEVAVNKPVELPATGIFIDDEQGGKQYAVYVGCRTRWIYPSRQLSMRDLFKVGLVP